MTRESIVGVVVAAIACKYRYYVTTVRQLLCEISEVLCCRNYIRVETLVE